MSEHIIAYDVWLMLYADVVYDSIVYGVLFKSMTLISSPPAGP